MTIANPLQCALTMRRHYVHIVTQVKSALINGLDSQGKKKMAVEGIHLVRLEDKFPLGPT